MPRIRNLRTLRSAQSQGEVGRALLTARKIVFAADDERGEAVRSHSRQFYANVAGAASLVKSWPGYRAIIPSQRAIISGSALRRRPKG